LILLPIELVQWIHQTTLAVLCNSSNSG